jgi:hypothetical protein
MELLSMKSNRFKNSTLLVRVVAAVAGCAEPLAVVKQNPPSGGGSCRTEIL